MAKALHMTCDEKQLSTTTLTMARQDTATATVALPCIHPPPI